MAKKQGKQQADAPYQVVARRFRPQTFQELVGQDEVLQSLRAALGQQRIPHAFLFAGSRGVGKTTSARILARCLNCEQGPTPEPCGSCEACRSILGGKNPDVMEIDAASNNLVDDVRRLRDSVGFATMQSRYRVVILDEAHMMTKNAFNAFLKTLEEPPPRVVFILATTELHKVPETIRSRCQVLLFRRVGEGDLHKRLRSIAEREAVVVADEVLAEIAASVRGGVRDAETALERILPLLREDGAAFDLAAYRALVARVGVEATAGVVAALLAGDARAGLHFARDSQQHGVDEREALGEIVDVLRWLLLLKIDGADSGLVPATGALRSQLQSMAASTESHRLEAMIGAGVLGRERMRRLEDRAAVFEIALVRMAQAGTLPMLADLLAEVRAGGGVLAQTRAPVVPTRPSAGRESVGRESTGRERGGTEPVGAEAMREVAPPPAVAAAAMGPRAAERGDLKSTVLGMLRDRALLQATFELCRVDGPGAEDRVVVTLVTERKMHRDRMGSPVVQQELTKVLQAAAGRPVKVEFRSSGEENAAGVATAVVKVEPGPAAKRVLEKFRGRVVEVNPDDGVAPEPKLPRADSEPGEPPLEPPLGARE